MTHSDVIAHFIRTLDESNVADVAHFGHVLLVSTSCSYVVLVVMGNVCLTDIIFFVALYKEQLIE